MNIAFFNDSPITPIETVQYQTIDQRTLTFRIKRDDLIDCSISGNKWRKLKYNFSRAHQLDFGGVASFGGAFSNHISALAAAGFRSGFKTLGFIRTHEIDSQNPTLNFAQQCGMRLIPLSREQYRLRHNESFLAELKIKYPDYFFVPEGGSNNFAQQGVTELAYELSKQATFSHLAVPLGSGGTTFGLATELGSKQIIAVAAVNDKGLFEQIHQQCTNVTIDTSSLFGGYGKMNSVLLDFCLEFFEQTGVPIEPIYSGKLFYALCYGRKLSAKQLAQTVVIHTGGLQGVRGLVYRELIDQQAWQGVLQHLSATKS